MTRLLILLSFLFSTADYAALTGSVFFPEPVNPFQAPQVRELKVPEIPEAQSIWGATGRDARGHIWIGVSTRKAGTSAHLLEFNPETEAWIDHGSVVDQLRRVGLHSPGTGQIKIHSKIIQAEDGWLYFASMDEEGEDPINSVLPKNGSHLWRLHPVMGNWEHLFAAPEGLVAAGGAGRYVYALGYWNHVLYQYDTKTKKTRHVIVGAAGGHVSRNFLADIRGHSFVPQVTRRADGTHAAALIEYNDQLREIGATDLQYYLNGQSPEENHGIVGLAYLPDRRLVFTTHRGQIYEIAPGDDGPAIITPRGWMHPVGEAYAPGLYAFGGTMWLAGITQRGAAFEWVVRNLADPGRSRAFPIDVGSLRNVLLYGSITADNVGRIYAVGWAANARGGQRPLVLQITPSR